ncbi:MAG: exo-alpha-sialidase, partial [Lysobacter sp.]
MKTLMPAVVISVVVLVGCDRERERVPVAPVEVTAAPTKVYRVHDWPLPITAQAAQPDLIIASDGRVLLSWIEPRGKGHALRFADFAAGKWRAPRDIATGSNWFVNWADTPHIAVTEDGALWAHWLQKSAAATYAYDVALVRSEDDGATWSQPMLVNDDGKPVEHGFVSLWPATRDAVGVSWLDGRNSVGEHAGHDGHAGAMTLRAARFDAKLQRSGESEIDAMTCDCCQTDIAATARGALLVYRDRSHEEIRDIAVTRAHGDAWTPPRMVHADGWKMPACPVNGPAVAARG